MSKVVVLQCDCGCQTFYIHQTGLIECSECSEIKRNVLATEGTVIEQGEDDVIH